MTITKPHETVDMDKTTIGLVGIGLMGTALAERLLDAGWTVIGYDIDRAARERLDSLGGQGSESAVDVAARCQTILLSLPDSDVVQDVVDQIVPQITGPAVLIDTTTGDPERSAALAERLAGQGIDYLDAPIAGSSAQTRLGQVMVMVGGEQRALDRCRRVLDALAPDVFHVGGWGSGARMKLIVNLVLGLNRAVLAEALALAKASGVPPAKALEVLRCGAAYSTVMDTKGPKMVSGDFTPQARLAQHLKDVRLILQLGDRTGASLPLSTIHEKLLEEAANRGYGDQDNSAVLKAFEE